MTEMKLKIIHEDNHILAVDKDPGQLSQGDISGEKPLPDIIKEYLKVKYSKKGNVFLAPAHRLDKPVSGIMLFARTSKSARRLHAAFITSGIKKFYMAITENPSSIATNKGEWHELNQFMKRVDDISVITGTQEPGSVPVRLKYMAVKRNKSHALVLIELITGKKHQIRSQLSSIGAPIAGDTRYGSREIVHDKSIYLHAFSIIMEHPVKKIPMELFTEIPEKFISRMEISTGDREWIIREIQLTME